MSATREGWWTLTAMSLTLNLKSNEIGWRSLTGVTITIDLDQI